MKVYEKLQFVVSAKFINLVTSISTCGLKNNVRKSETITNWEIKTKSTQFIFQALKRRKLPNFCQKSSLFCWFTVQPFPKTSAVEARIVVLCVCIHWEAIAAASTTVEPRCWGRQETASEAARIRETIGVRLSNRTLLQFYYYSSIKFVVTRSAFPKGLSWPFQKENLHQ